MGFWRWYLKRGLWERRRLDGLTGCLASLVSFLIVPSARTTPDFQFGIPFDVKT